MRKGLPTPLSVFFAAGILDVQALHFANVYGFPVLAESLLEAGADPDIYNARGEPAGASKEASGESALELYDWSAWGGASGAESDWEDSRRDAAQIDAQPQPQPAPVSVKLPVIKAATVWRPPPAAPPPSIIVQGANEGRVMVRRATTKRPPPRVPFPAAALPQFRDPAATSSGRGDVVPMSSTPKDALQPQMALMEAMASQDYPAMNRALEQASDREVHSAMLNACGRGNYKAVNILLDRAPEESLSQGSIISARSGHIAVLRLLLSTTTEPSATGNSLVQAATRGHAAMVREVAEMRRADGEAIRRALLASSSKGYAECVLALIPVADYEDRRLALVAACSAGQYQAVVEALVDTLPGEMLDQPLAACAARGQLELARCLLSSRNVSDLSPGAVVHARGVALSREEPLFVNLLSFHLRQNFPEVDGVAAPSPSHPPALLSNKLAARTPRGYLEH